MGKKPTYEELERMVEELEKEVFECNRAEEALERTQKELETIVDSVPALIAFKDKNNRYIRINKTYSDFINIPWDDIKGKSAFDIAPSQELAEAYWRDDKEVMASGIPKRNIIEPLIFDETKTIQTDKIPYRDDKGNIEGVIAFCIDITSRVEAEEALEKERNLLRTVIDNLRDYIFVKDTESRYLICNNAFARFLGAKTPEEVIGKTPFELYPREMAAQYYADDQKVIRSGQAVVNRKERSVDQTEKRGVWNETTKVPLRDSSGKIVGLVGLTRDISERKRAEEELEKERNLLRTVIDNVPDYIYVKDAESRYLVSNNAFARLFGDVTPEEVVGKTTFELFPPEVARKYYADDQEVILSGNPLLNREDSPVNKEGKTIWNLTSKLPLRDSSGKIVGLVCIAREIIEKKQAEEALKKSHDELEQALLELKTTQAHLIQSEKMASIGQLAAGVAHEINNPTGFVSSNLKTLSDYQGDIFRLIREYRKLTADLKKPTASQETISGNLDRIEELEREIDIDFIQDDTPNLIKESQEGAERIKKIVVDLKDFAHPGEQKLQYADINKNLDSTLNVVWNELKYKATVTKDYGDLPEVQCYPQQLNQVFVNLLVNAARAIEKKGGIRIATRALDAQVEIKISDTGVGIPKENLSRLFDPFFTTKEVGKGTGLGLNVAYNIIKRHKATIDVESEVGKGTTFIIRLQTDPDLVEQVSGGMGE